MDKKISLEEVASEAMFSKFHFHRIFKAVTNETFNNYAKRIKLEKACKVLVAGKNSTITDLAFKMGYKTVAGFSRDFSDYFGISPTEIQKNGQRPIERKVYLDKELNLKFIEVRVLSEKKILYQRVSSGYDIWEIQKAFNQLFEFAKKNQFLESIEQFVGVGYDDPDYTPADKCRYDASMIVKEDYKIGEECPFNLKNIAGGKYAIFSFSGKNTDFHTAWDIVFKKWLISSNYLPDNKPHFEMYLPSEHFNDGIFKVNLCLPVIKQ